MGLKTTMSLTFLWFLLMFTWDSNATPMGHRSLGVQDSTDGQDRQDRSFHSIVGGQEVQPNSWPSLVRITKQRSRKWDMLCGGSILDDLHVLSAANCFNDENANYIVTAGEHDITKTSGLEQTVRVAEIVRHPDYEAPDKPGARLRYDVAVLRLSQRLRMSEKVKAIKLNDERTCPRRGDICALAGWGETCSGNRKRSDVPLAVNLTVRSVGYCEFDEMNFHNEQLCTNTTGKSAYLGDAGGPLICDCGGTEKQVGVMSYRDTHPACNPRNYFAKVSFFYEWINETIHSQANHS